MTIELEKILTISARDYCEMHGRKLSQYDCKGIHFWERQIRPLNLPEEFAKVVPEGTEVIVEYRFTNGGEGRGHDQYASGTALIPKK